VNLQGEFGLDICVLECSVLDGVFVLWLAWSIRIFVSNLKRNLSFKGLHKLFTNRNALQSGNNNTHVSSRPPPDTLTFRVTVIASIVDKALYSWAMIGFSDLTAAIAAADLLDGHFVPEWGVHLKARVAKHRAPGALLESAMRRADAATALAIRASKQAVAANAEAMKKIHEASQLQAAKSGWPGPPPPPVIPAPASSSSPHLQMPMQTKPHLQMPMPMQAKSGWPGPPPPLQTKPMPTFPRLLRPPTPRPQHLMPPQDEPEQQTSR